jgi:hypothetical protein
MHAAFVPLSPRCSPIRKSATSTGPLGGFSDLRKLVAFAKIRKSATSPKDKTGGASALPFTRPFSRWHCVRRGKVEGPGGNYGFADRSTPELPAFVHNRIAFDSLYCGIHIRISV